MGNDQSNISHDISVTQLQLADHIYRHNALTSLSDSMFLQHHGIVTYVPDASKQRKKKKKNRSIKVLEWIEYGYRNFYGIRQVSLRRFLHGRKLRRVRYDVTAWYESVHIKGSCHRVRQSGVETILKRCKILLANSKCLNHSICFKKLTSHQFGFFCATGIIEIAILNTPIAEFFDRIEGEEDREDSVEQELNDREFQDDTIRAELMLHSNKNEQQTPTAGDVISINDLQLGDHIYRHLKAGSTGYDMVMFQHHGIVTHIPFEEKRNEDNVMVLEMTSHGDFHGIREISLKDFLEDKKLRRVRYGVCGGIIAGTYHEQQKSDVSKIILRCEQMKQTFGGINGTYSLTGWNCEHFAYYCATGIIPCGNQVTQLQKVEESVSSMAQLGLKEAGKAIVKKGMTSLSSVSSVTKTIGNTVELVGTEAVTVSTESGKDVLQSSAGAASAWSAFGWFAGVGIAIETAITAYRIGRYCTDVNVLWHDTKMQIAKGWITVAWGIAMGAVGIGFGFGGWVILPMLAGSGLIWWLFRKYGKTVSDKEKLFKERGLKMNASIREKKAEIRKINREINEGKLHPNSWNMDLPDKYVINCTLDERPFGFSIAKYDGEKEYGAIIQVNNGKIEKMSMWYHKRIKSGMILYTINNCVVISDEFEEIQSKFDELSEQDVIGVFEQKKVEKEQRKRMEKYMWLTQVKNLILEDIQECKSKRKRRKKRKRSTPLAITL